MRANTYKEFYLEYDSLRTEKEKARKVESDLLYSSFSIL